MFGGDADASSNLVSCSMNSERPRPVGSGAFSFGSGVSESEFCRSLVERLEGRLAEEERSK